MLSGFNLLEREYIFRKVFIAYFSLNDRIFFLSRFTRLSTVTEIPAELWELSEPLQVKNFLPGQFQAPRQDSEPVNKDIPCCLYGDINKRCRVCRYCSCYDLASSRLFLVFCADILNRIPWIVKLCTLFFLLKKVF